MTEQQAQTQHLNNDQFSALHNMAYVFLQHNQFNKAGALYKVLYELEPNNALITLSLAYVLSCINKHQEAEQLISSLVNKEEAMPLAYLINCKILIAKNENQAAGKQLQQYSGY